MDFSHPVVKQMIIEDLSLDVRDLQRRNHVHVVFWSFNMYPVVVSYSLYMYIKQSLQQLLAGDDLFVTIHNIIVDNGNQNCSVEPIITYSLYDLLLCSRTEYA